MSREFFLLFIPFSRLIFLFDTGNMTGNGFSQSGTSKVSINVPNIFGTPVLPAFLLIATHPNETKGSGEEGQGTRAGERPEVEVDVESVGVVNETIM